MVGWHDLLICIVVGVVAPFLTQGLTKLRVPEPVETFLNLFISAGVSAILTTPFDGNWGGFLLAFVTTWLVTGRTYLTKLPATVYVNSDTGKHARPDDQDPQNELP